MKIYNLPPPCISVCIYICIRGLYIYKPQSLLSQIFTFILCVCVCTHVCMFCTHEEKVKKRKSLFFQDKIKQFFPCTVMMYEPL